jgi:DNA-binding MarR family transcriptional regulator
MVAITLDEFADRLTQIVPVFMREFSQRLTDELHRGKITVPQLIIMTILEKEGTMMMKDLARFMNVSTAAMTGLIQRLVRAGFAKRMFVPADRRVIRVELTVKGAELLKKVNDQRRKMIMEVFGRLGVEERVRYLDTITKVRDILLEKKA